MTNRNIYLSYWSIKSDDVYGKGEGSDDEESVDVDREEGQVACRAQLSRFAPIVHQQQQQQQQEEASVSVCVQCPEQCPEQGAVAASISSSCNAACAVSSVQYAVSTIIRSSSAKLTCE